MSRPQEIDDKFAQIVLSLEEAIFELEEIINNHSLSEKEIEDLITTKELAQSARDLSISVIASANGKKLPNQE